MVAALVLHAVWVVPFVAVSLVLVDVALEVGFAVCRVVHDGQVDVGLRLVHLILGVVP